MTVSPGARLGACEITNAIGAGGMGEVFRARDTKLNRDVAIKVLPAAFADDPERLARFTREAQTLASLNHPNIATIYGIEEIAGIASSASQADLLAMTGGAKAGGSRALVMELVEPVRYPSRRQTARHYRGRRRGRRGPGQGGVLLQLRRLSEEDRTGHEAMSLAPRELEDGDLPLGG